MNRSVELLRGAGLQPGFPHSSAIKGANFALRERAEAKRRRQEQALKDEQEDDEDD